MQPFVELNSEPAAQATSKLWNIATFDFGVPTGKTCEWKTSWCKKLCYGPSCSGARFPTARPGWLKRLNFIEKASPDMFYAHILAYAAYGVPIRIGRFGDASNPAVVAAIIAGLKKTKVKFMWPTRAWRTPSHPSWKLIEEHLPGEVICSMDESSILKNERPPEGYPVSYIATRRYGFLAYPIQSYGYDIRWCPHYPHPQMHMFEVACQNCYQCQLCYARPGDYKGRLNIVYLQHTTKGRARSPRSRTAYPPEHFRKLWKAGKRWDIQPGHTLKDYEEEYETEQDVVTACGIWTSDGWYAPDDDV